MAMLPALAGPELLAEIDAYNKSAAPAVVRDERLQVQQSQLKARKSPRLAQQASALVLRRKRVLRPYF